MKRVTSLLLVLFVLTMPQVAWSMTPEEFDEQAIPLMTKPKEADKLLKLCEQALADAKQDPEFEAFIRVVKSHGHLLKKEYSKAEAEARIVIDSKRQGDLGYSALKDVLFAQGRFQEGRQICMDGVSRVNPHNQAVASQDCEDDYLSATSITPETLWNAYKKNAATADAKYKSTSITMLGTVTRAEPSGASVFFEVDKKAATGVVCLFNVPERAQGGSGGKNAKKNTPLLPLSGDTVIISGKVRGVEGGNVVLTGCTLAAQ